MDFILDLLGQSLLGNRQAGWAGNDLAQAASLDATSQLEQQLGTSHVSTLLKQPTKIVEVQKFIIMLGTNKRSSSKDYWD